MDNKAKRKIIFMQNHDEEITVCAYPTEVYETSFIQTNDVKKNQEEMKN